MAVPRLGGLCCSVSLNVHAGRHDMGGGWVSPAGGLDDDDHDDVLATSWGGGSWDDTAAT